MVKLADFERDFHFEAVRLTIAQAERALAGLHAALYDG